MLSNCDAFRPYNSIICSNDYQWSLGLANDNSVLTGNTVPMCITTTCESASNVVLVVITWLSGMRLKYRYIRRSPYYVIHLQAQACCGFISYGTQYSSHFVLPRPSGNVFILLLLSRQWTVPETYKDSKSNWKVEPQKNYPRKEKRKFMSLSWEEVTKYWTEVDTYRGTYSVY